MSDPHENQPGATPNGGGADGPGVPPRPQTPPQRPAGEPTTRFPAADQHTAQYPAHQQGQQGAYGQPGPYGQQHGGYGQQHGPYGGHPGAYGAQGQPASFGPVAPERRRDRRTFGAPVLVAGMLAAALVGGGAAIGADYLIDEGAGTVATQPSGNAEGLVINNPENVTAVTAAAAKAAPSVVTIEVSDGGSSGSGSGVVLDREGHILTNTHVVTMGGASGDANVTVRTADGGVHRATIVGTDPLSDLAVIKIEAQNLTPIEMGVSGELNVGDPVVAIGAPLGLSGTVTDGIVSTLNRTISVASSAVPDAPTEGQEGGEGGDRFNFEFPGQENQSGQGSIFLNVIQTDAAINHGNSGGALVDINGKLVGINVAIASPSQESGSIGVGFAIPVDYAKRIAQDLIEDGSASHGLLGVTVQAQAPEAGGRTSSFSVGAVVREVVPNSPADQAGLQRGDVITGVNGRPIGDSKSLTAAVREYAGGTKAELTVQRDGQERKIEVTIGESGGN